MIEEVQKCVDCEFASWKKTAAGRLHPNGEGICTYVVEFPMLPRAQCYTLKPSVSYRYINRKDTPVKPCPVFVAKS